MTSHSVKLRVGVVKLNNEWFCYNESLSGKRYYIMSAKTKNELIILLGEKIILLNSDRGVESE